MLWGLELPAFLIEALFDIVCSKEYLARYSHLSSCHFCSPPNMVQFSLLVPRNPIYVDNWFVIHFTDLLEEMKSKPRFILRGTVITDILL